MHWKQLATAEGTRQSVISLGGTLLGTGISALTIIFISRLVGPAEFGIFSLLFAIIQVMNKIGDSGFNFALHKFVPSARHESSAAAREMIAHITGLRLVIVGALFGLLLLASPVVTAVFRLPLWWLYPAGVLLAAVAVFFEHLMFLLQSLQKFVLASGMFVAQSTLKLVGVGALIFLGIKDGTTVTLTYFTLPLFVAVPFLLPLAAWLRVTFTYQSALKKKVLAFVRHNSIQVISSALADNIDILFIQLFMGVYATGVYGGISRIAFLVTVLGASLGNVLNVRVSRYTKPGDIRSFLKKSLAVWLIALAGGVISMALVHPLITFTIGVEYLSASWELVILLFSSWLYFVTIPYIAYFYSIDRPNYFSVMGVVLMVVLIGADVLFIPSFGLMGAAVARVIARGAVLLGTVWWLKKEYGVRSRESE